MAVRGKDAVSGEERIAHVERPTPLTLASRQRQFIKALDPCVDRRSDAVAGVNQKMAENDGVR